MFALLLAVSMSLKPVASPPVPRAPARPHVHHKSKAHRRSKRTAPEKKPFKPAVLKAPRLQPTAAAAGKPAAPRKANPAPKVAAMSDAKRLNGAKGAMGAKAKVDKKAPGADRARAPSAPARTRPAPRAVPRLGGLKGPSLSGARAGTRAAVWRAAVGAAAGAATAAPRRRTADAGLGGGGGRRGGSRKAGGKRDPGTGPGSGAQEKAEAKADKAGKTAKTKKGGGKSGGAGPPRLWSSGVPAPLKLVGGRLPSAPASSGTKDGYRWVIEGGRPPMLELEKKLYEYTPVKGGVCLRRVEDKQTTCVDDPGWRVVVVAGLNRSAELFHEIEKPEFVGRLVDRVDTVAFEDKSILVNGKPVLNAYRPASAR